jgi:hypothetical protein
MSLLALFFAALCAVALVELAHAQPPASVLTFTGDVEADFFGKPGVVVSVFHGFLLKFCCLPLFSSRFVGDFSRCVVKKKTKKKSKKAKKKSQRVRRAARR